MTNTTTYTVTKEIRTLIQNTVNETILKANQRFLGYDFSDLKVVIDDTPISKKTAAFYRPRTKTIHLNKVMICTFETEVMIKTVIHEIAHHVTDTVFPNEKQAHGSMFKRIDKALGGEGTAKVNSIKSSQAFSEAVNINTKTFNYMCLCRTVQFTSNRHSRVLKGTTYNCGFCNKLFKHDPS